MDELYFFISIIFGIIIVYQFSKTFYDSKGYYLEDPDDYKESEYFSQRFIFPVYPKYLIDRWKYHLWFFTFLLFNYMFYSIIVYLLYNSKIDINIPEFNEFQKLMYSSYPGLFGA